MTPETPISGGDWEERASGRLLRVTRTVPSSRRWWDMPGDVWETRPRGGSRRVISRFAKFPLVAGTLALVFGPRLAPHRDDRVSALSLTASVLAPTTGDHDAVAPSRGETRHDGNVVFALVGGA